MEYSKMNEKFEKVYLVYVNFGGKAHAQKWYGSKVNPNTSNPYPEGFFACEPILLKEQDRNLTLKELCERYPLKSDDYMSHNFR